MVFYFRESAQTCIWAIRLVTLRRSWRKDKTCINIKKHQFCWMPTSMSWKINRNHWKSLWCVSLYRISSFYKHLISPTADNRLLFGFVSPCRGFKQQITWFLRFQADKSTGTWTTEMFLCKTSNCKSSQAWPLTYSLRGAKNLLLEIIKKLD